MTSILAITVLIGGPLVAMTGYWLMQRLSAQRALEERLAAINWCQQGLEFMTLLQQRRGMMGAQIKGDTQFAVALKSAGQKLETLEKSLSSTRLQTRPPAEGEDELRLYSELSQQRFTSPDASFRAHSEAISRLQNQIWFVAEGYGLITHPDRHVHGVSSEAFRLLPELIELLAQMRGLSTLAASEGRCSATLRLRLTYLASQIRQTLKNVTATPEPADAFVRQVEAEILSSERLNIDAKTLFAQATGAIEVYLTETSNLLQRLQVR